MKGCHYKLALFLSSSLDFAAGQLERAYWASWTFGVAKCVVLHLLDFKLPRQIIPARQICRCMLYEEAQGLSFPEMLKVKGGKNDLFVCFTEGD